MKSYSHLYEQFLAEDNIDLAIRRSSKGKRKRRDVKLYLAKDPAVMEHIRRYARNFKNKKHEPVFIYDGVTRKRRKIIVPAYDEQIVHHMVVNVMIPIFKKGMYEHSYASLPKRGAHVGKRQLERWIRRDTKNCKYFLKMDIRKFFDSIPHDIIIEKLRMIIHDARFMSILEELISVTDQGLPLGFYTSQWLANWYLQDLDHYIKEELGAVHYERYMDDMVISGPSKRNLHKIRKAISDYLQERLGLTLKGNWQVFRFDYLDRKGKRRGRFLDYMGFRFYRDRTTLRRSIMIKASRKARKVSKEEKIPIYEIRQVLSYLGWIKCTDTYWMYTEWIKPYVSYQHCKRRISRYDNRQNKKKEEEEGGVVQGRKCRKARKRKHRRVKGL